MALYDNKGKFLGVQPAKTAPLYGAGGLAKPTPQPSPSILPNLNQSATISSDLKNTAKDALQSGRDIMERQLTKKQSFPSTAFQFAGLGAKTAGELVFGLPAHVIEQAIPDAERKPLEAIFSKAFSAIGKTKTVQTAIQRAHDFAAAHPEAAANISAGGQIAGTFVGAGAAKEVAPLAEDALRTGADAAGNAFRTVTGPVSDHFASKTAAAEAEKVLELTRPVLSTADKEAALAAGRGKPGSLLKKATITPAARDIERADIAHPFIAGTKDTNQAIDNVNNAIQAKSEIVKTGLKASGGPIFNKNQLRSYIAKFQQSPERQIILAGDDAAKKAYNGVLDTFMSVVDRHPKTVSGLLDARKEFDQIAEKGMKGVFGDGTVSARKQAILDIRRQANQYIEDQIPTGDAMKEVLHQQNLLFEARDNIAAKAAKNVGKSKIQQFAKDHPTPVKALKYGSFGVAGGAAEHLLIP